MRPVFAYRAKNIFIMKPFFALRANKTLHTGVRIGCHCLISLFVCLSAKFVVFTDCESCTRPISTNPGYVETGEYALNAWDVFRRTPSQGGRGRRVAVDSVVCFGCGGISCFFLVFFSSNHGLLQV